MTGIAMETKARRINMKHLLYCNLRRSQVIVKIRKRSCVIDKIANNRDLIQWYGQ